MTGGGVSSTAAVRCLNNGTSASGGLGGLVWQCGSDKNNLSFLNVLLSIAQLRNLVSHNLWQLGAVLMGILPRKVGCISLCFYSDGFIRKITRGILAIRYLGLGGDSLHQFTGDVIWCEFVVFITNRFAL